MFTSELVDKYCQVTGEDHMDLFDKDRLVYLSPDSRNDLKEVCVNEIASMSSLFLSHTIQLLCT